MKKITKSIISFLAAAVLLVQLSPYNANAAVDRHFAIKNTTTDSWYGITADVNIPTTINGLGSSSAGLEITFCDETEQEILETLYTDDYRTTFHWDNLDEDHVYRIYISNRSDFTAEVKVNIF